MHKSLLWIPICIFHTAVKQSLCKTAICISDSTWPTCLDVEVFIRRIIIILDGVSALITASSPSYKSWIVSKRNTAAVVDRKHANN